MEINFLLDQMKAEIYIMCLKMTLRIWDTTSSLTAPDFPDFLNNSWSPEEEQNLIRNVSKIA
jgi:hypothetical protein